MAAVYPGQIKSFTARTDFVDTILAAHMNEAQDEIAAIQSVLGVNPASGSASVSSRISSLEATVTDPNHKHSGADITSGTLVVARGGTGAGTHTVGSYLLGNGTGAFTSKTPAQVLSDIGAAGTGHTHTPASIGAATTSHTHSQGELTGTVEVPDGGTGRTTLTSGSFLQGNGAGIVNLRTPAQVLTDIGAAASGHSHTAAAVGASPTGHTHTPAESGAAAASHNHDALDITSGSLSVPRGGTGASALTSGNFLRGNGTGAVTTRTPAQVLTDIGAAAIAHNHSAADITSGTLAVARGGTGVTSFTSGSFVKGNGASIVMRTPTEVRTDIGAAPTSHSHTAGDLPPSDAVSDVLLLGGM